MCWGVVPQRVRGCACSLSHIGRLTHLKWLPALVWGRCGGSGTVLCTPGRTKTKSAVGGLLEKRHDHHPRPPQPQGLTPPLQGLPSSQVRTVEAIYLWLPKTPSP